jgi:hypothetical protein
MDLHNETAAPTAIGNGGDISKGVTAGNYRTITLSATEIATSIIAARFQLSHCMARVIVELASIGGRMG